MVAQFGQNRYQQDDAIIFFFSHSAVQNAALFFFVVHVVICFFIASSLGMKFSCTHRGVCCCIRSTRLALARSSSLSLCFSFHLLFFFSSLSRMVFIIWNVHTMLHADEVREQENERMIERLHIKICWLHASDSYVNFKSIHIFLCCLNPKRIHIHLALSHQLHAHRRRRRRLHSRFGWWLLSLFKHFAHSFSSNRKCLCFYYGSSLNRVRK